MTVPVQLPIAEMFEIMEAAGVRNIMAHQRKRRVTIDYIPGSEAIYRAREAEDDELDVFPRQRRTLTFILEDQMFGGDVYAAITCEGRVILAPFPWRNHAHFANMRLVLKEQSR